jgi:hypothetical protein
MYDSSYYFVTPHINIVFHSSHLDVYLTSSSFFTLSNDLVETCVSLVFICVLSVCRLVQKWLLVEIGRAKAERHRTWLDGIS